MSIEDWINVIVYDWMWGTPLVVFVLGAGFYISIRSGFFQLTWFGKAMKRAKETLFGQKKDDASNAGVLSSLEAMSTAIGTTVGVGNIGGVATALAVGGPGAIFWMWVSGLLGMIVKSAEITLAVHYRVKDGDKEAYGGPNYYMKHGIGEEMKKPKLYIILSALFAIGFSLSYFINIQTYTVAEALESTFNFSMMGSAILFTVVLYGMISGGLKGIGKIATFLVPFMCLFYLIGGLFIVITHIGTVPGIIGQIFSNAFTGTAAAGGFAGATVKLALQTGMARSVFSNEAGWGTAPMIHASAQVDHPVKQGMLGIFEVFVDTFIICTMTCLVIMCTGQWNSGLDGAALTLSAFESGLGVVGRYILAIGVFLFGITTSSGLYAQIEVVLRYVVGESKAKKFALAFYKWTYPLPSLLLVVIAVAGGLSGSTVWIISDAGVGLPIFINLAALVILTPKFLALTKDYKARFLGQGKVDPDFKIFYDEAQDKVAKENISKEV
ncbi:MAG: sodium:alanine symporter family protein [Lachnospiraceae bacterium]|nr:sodium:alanine symporter family protein [Candidatus Equihabitans merdae]